MVKKDNNVNFINSEGKILSDIWFESALNFNCQGFSVVKREDGKQNLLKQNGELPINIVIKCDI